MKFTVKKWGGKYAVTDESNPYRRFAYGSSPAMWKVAKRANEVGYVLDVHPVRAPRGWPGYARCRAADPQKGDTLTIPGVDFGTYQPDVVWRGDGSGDTRHGDWVIVRQRGSTEWSSRGQTSYYPTKYLLCRLRDSGQWELHAECEPGRKYRAAIKDMKALAAMRS